jgi:protein-S-isoprenylcysteine O-methyltransferase Ste14
MALMLVSLGLHLFLERRLGPPLRSVAGGCVLIALGFLLMTWAWWLFRQRKTAICPTASASTMVDRGPFHFTRNPMYLGMALMLTGGSLILGSLPAFLAPAAFLLLMNAVFIPFEENRMSLLFGEQYASYRHRTRRWL